MPQNRLALLLAVCVSFVGTSASAQATLMRDLGGEAGFGEGSLELNDDSSSGLIDMTAAFPTGLEYFGQRFTGFYVNNNGSITFGGPTSTYTPSPFPLSGNRMIAPFWGDVDTRGGGRPGRNGVYWDVQPGRVVVTWYRVGYYGTHDDLQNSFQLIIESNPSLEADHVWRVEIRYAQLRWTTGDASGGAHGHGGTPAQAGFDAGDGVIAQVLPGSGTSRVLRLAHDSNVGEAGVWIFNIHNGVPNVVIGDGETQTFDFSQPEHH
jgi:hypothetical protein